MKKLSLLILSIVAIATGFAQQSNLEFATVKKITTGEVVSSLKIYNNLEVVLTEDTTSTVKIIGEKLTVESIQVKISGGELAISGVSEISAEKVTVYVPAIHLQSIYIHGGSKVSTAGILTNEYLDVNINGTGRVAIQTTGRVSQNTVEDYPTQELTTAEEI